MGRIIILRWWDIQSKTTTLVVYNTAGLCIECWGRKYHSEKDFRLKIFVKSRKTIDEWDFNDKNKILTLLEIIIW